ncbi:hypothetical protein ACWDFH_20590, partial [Streptomyces kronopolitis]
MAIPTSIGMSRNVIGGQGCGTVRRAEYVTGCSRYRSRRPTDNRRQTGSRDIRMSTIELTKDNFDEIVSGND